MAQEKVEYIRKLAVQQLESLLTLGGKELEGTQLELQIKLAVSTLGQTAHQESSISVEEFEDDDRDTYDYDDEYDEDEEPQVPVGFADEDDYQAFVETQAEVLPTYENTETGELITPRPDDVVGVVNGVNVGNMEESLAKTTEIVEESFTIRDEETGDVLYKDEPTEVASIKVFLQRNDGNELTFDQVSDDIFDSRVAQTMLQMFGEDYTIENSEDPSKKIVSFKVDNDNDVSRKVSQGLVHGRGVMQFGGVAVIPGLGAIKTGFVQEI